MTADMSVAPEIARLAKADLLVAAQPATPSAGKPDDTKPDDTKPDDTKPDDTKPDDREHTTITQPTLGTLARQLRSIAATPEHWWGLVRFEPGRPVTITVEECAAYQAWLVIMPPGDAGQSCDCDVATMIAGEASEGTPGRPVLRPGPVRVHGERHGLRGRGAGYSISLHARAHRPVTKK